MPWFVRKSDKLMLKQVKNPEPLKSLITQVKFRYYGHYTWSDGSLEDDIMLGMIEGGRGKEEGSPLQETVVGHSGRAVPTQHCLS